VSGLEKGLERENNRIKLTIKYWTLASRRAARRNYMSQDT